MFIGLPLSTIPLNEECREALRRFKPCGVFTGVYDDHSFLTNHISVAAKTIADLYKDPWQVELFFKWIKQNLKIKSFVGISQNAVWLSKLTFAWDDSGMDCYVCLFVTLLSKVSIQTEENRMANTAFTITKFILKLNGAPVVINVY